MAYKRKTVDRWDILTNFGYGWDCEYSTYDLEDARTQYKRYRENACGNYTVRMEKHREKLEAA